MALALVALVVPTVDTNAAGRASGPALVAAWADSATVRTYSETSRRIDYTGTWRRADHPGHMGGHVRFATGRNAKASLAFEGSAVSWIGPVGPTRGKANVWIDGRLVKTVNTWAASFTPARVLFKMEWNSVKSHRITIAVLGTSGHPTVALDALIVRTSTTLDTAARSKPRPAATVAPTAAPTANAPQGTPKVLLSEDIGPAGTRTILALSGFAGGTTGEIDFDGSTAGMPSYTTAPDGSTKVTVTIPLDAGLGQHQINARGPDGNSLMMRIFEVTASPASPVAPVPTVAPTPVPTVAPTPVPTVAPTPATTTYAAVFGGDATGATDVTSTLRTFLQSHNGQRVALATNGIYKVTRLTFTASNLTVDFRGSRLQGAQVGVAGIFNIQGSTNLVLNDAKVYGTGYSYSLSTEGEDGIGIYGGSNITLNNPVTRNTRGDGIYIGYNPGWNLPAKGVVINNANIERAARNGIAPVAGEVTIRGGHIAYVGLHGVDFEPNDAAGARSTVGVVDGVDIRRCGDLPVGYPGYAISGGWGYLGSMKPSLVFQNNTGDRLSIVVMNTSTVKILDNTSDIAAIAEIIDSTNISYAGNVRITRL